MTTRQFRRPPTAQEAVLTELRRAITEGEFRPGAAINQEELARTYGLSRVPVREALRLLEGEGLVSYTPHIGYTVAHLSFDEIEEIYQLRELLESEAVRCGMPEVSDADLVRMRELLNEAETQRKAGDVRGLSLANRKLHFAMVQPCGMPRLLRLLNGLYDATEPYRPVYYMHDHDRGCLREEHEDIIAAFESRDTEEVIRRMNEHRGRLVAALRQGIAEHGEPPR